MEDKGNFLCGYAPFSDLLVCATARAGLGETVPEGDYPFRCYLLDGEEWGQYATMFNWAPVAMASVKPAGGERTVVALGARGEIYEIRTSDGDEQTSVMPGKGGFVARNLAVVGDTIYAVGLGHCIARWERPMTWTRLDPNVKKDQAAGFNDLVAISADEMYTVGWGGEILRTDGQRWQTIDSPVSAALRSACIGSDKMVYAVGYNGTMVRGRGDDWSVVETGRQGVLLDVCAFRDEIFVADSFAVFRLGADGLEVVTEFEDPDDRPDSCVGLCASADGPACSGWVDLIFFGSLIPPGIG